MKKTISIALALMFVLSCMIVGSATIVKKNKTTYWFPWVQDGNEVTLNKVKTSDDGIVADKSANWEIKAQDTQVKITETYLSPATVWTKDTKKDFYLTYNVTGGSKVQFGFLHVVSDVGSEAANLALVKKDGSDLGQYVKLQASKDGATWTDVTTTFKAETATNRTAVLYSGMTGYPDPLTTNVGDGTAGYNEFYFIAEGTVPADAKFVRFFYVARDRSNFWDPCVRDAAFTEPAAESSKPESSKTENPETGDMTYIYVIAAVVLAGASVLVVKKRRA